jgi:hypothetical protein
MLNKKLTKEELAELKAYVKKRNKKLKEGSTTDGAGGYLTKAAFTGEEDGDGTTKDIEKDEYAYSIKAPKTNKHSVKLHEASYKAFKQDPNMSEVQKVNSKILEVSKMLREISRALDHSMKLKQESALDNTKYWKRTNEAILKISRRLSEINKKARKLANLKELAASAVKDKLVQAFVKAGIMIKSDQVSSNQTGPEHYEFDVMMMGEPYAIDYNNGELIYQDYDKEIRLGNLNQEPDLVKTIAQTFKP